MFRSPSRLRAALLAVALALMAADAGVASAASNGLIGVGLYPETGTARRIDLVQPDGKVAKTLAADLGELQQFSWSPDGSRLVGLYAPYPATSRPSGWYVVTNDGATWSALPNGISSVSFLPGGRLLLLRYGVSAEVPSGSIWTVNADGTGLTRILPTIALSVDGFGLLAAPDGKAAYYVEAGSKSAGRPDAIWRIDLATGARRLVHDRAASGGNSTLVIQDVSPDSRSLLFGEERSGQPGGGDSVQPAVLAVIGVDGGGLRTLPTKAGDRPGGRFSPDGKLVVYLGTHATNDATVPDPFAVDLRVMRLDGGGDVSLGGYGPVQQNGFTGLDWQPLRRVVISGVVSGAGGAAASVRAAARATVVATGAEGTFRTVVDARGRFELEVEPGRYRLAVQGRSGCVIVAGRCAGTQLVDATKDVTVRVLADPRGTKLALGLVTGARLAVARGKVAIPVRCVATKACTGTVALRRGRTTIATKRVTVKPGKTLRVKLAVGKRRGTMTARATAGRKTTSVSVRIG